MRPSGIIVVTRAVEILEAMAARGGTAGVSEIGKDLDLAKGTVQRILASLADKGVVNRDAATGRYSLGFKLVELAFAANKHFDLVSVALPLMAELRDWSHETVALSLRVGDEFFYVAQLVGSEDEHFAVGLGTRRKLHWGAPGKAILAFVSDDARDAYLAGPLAPRASRTIVSAAELRVDLDRIRAAGGAVSTSETTEGITAAAAPLLDRQGLAYASLSVIGPASRMGGEDVDALSARVKETAHKIEIIAASQR